MIKVKRVYDKASKEDGFRVLVDRLWPRGLTKEKAKVNLWLKEIAPSGKLRKWFSHDAGKWSLFQKMYVKELESKTGLISRVKQLEKEKMVVTLLFSAKDENHNNAAALAEYLKSLKRAKESES